MKKREELLPSGKNLEWFLRRNFGLSGQYYSDEFEAVIRKEQRGEDAFTEWFENHDAPEAYTKEAWEAWGRALAVVDDLVAMGLLKDGGIDSPAEEIRSGFCDLA